MCIAHRWKHYPSFTVNCLNDINLFANENNENLFTNKSTRQMLHSENTQLSEKHVQDSIYKYRSARLPLTSYAFSSWFFCGHLGLKAFTNVFFRFHVGRQAQYGAALSGYLSLMPVCSVLNVKKRFLTEKKYLLLSNSLTRCKSDPHSFLFSDTSFTDYATATPFSLDEFTNLYWSHLKHRFSLGIYLWVGVWIRNVPLAVERHRRYPLNLWWIAFIRQTHPLEPCKHHFIFSNSPEIFKKQFGSRILCLEGNYATSLSIICTAIPSELWWPGDGWKYRLQ